MTPKNEPLCCHCRRAFGNEMSWKIPVVILVIIVATALQFALRSIH